MAHAATIARSAILDRSVLDAIRSHRRVGLALGTSLAVVGALASAWLIPRGPVTTEQGLLGLAAFTGLGLASGFATGSRWSTLLTPLVFIAVFELARLQAVGPTVDAVRLDSTYGVIAFVTGRGPIALFVLLPMTLGTLFGVQLAALRSGGAGRLGRTGWVVMVALTAATAVAGGVLAMPASTAPIIGADGRPLPNSIAELTHVRLGGLDQALMIRARSMDNPVLLHLAGGPGGTDTGAMRDDVGLEQDFVVVTWDQRGTGRSYAALDPVETLTVEGMVDDTLELTRYLAARFDEQKIYLSGNSWGTFLGVLAVQREPELYHAYVGTGQMVSTVDTDRQFWADTITWAEAGGNVELATSMRAAGPPPYADLIDYEPIVSHEHDWNVYPGLATLDEMPFNTFVPENSAMDRINGLRGLLDTFAVLYPQLQAVDLRRDAAALRVPVYMVTGRHEARGRAAPADEWFELLQAPTKERIVFDRSGHRPSFEEPAAFAALMRDVRAETYPGSP